MKLSIIIPVYNSEKYLNECLSHVTNIFSKEVEVILINDGSNDKSLEICSSYCKIDKRFILINQDNQGVSAARNKGIEIASGKYLMFIDSDDYCQETVLNEFLESEHEEDILCYDYYYLKNETLIYKKRKIEDSFSLEDLFTLFLSGQSNEIWKNIYKVSIIKENSLLFESSMKMGEDLLFNLNYMKYCKNCRYINKPLYVYNLDNISSSTHKVRPEYLDNYIVLFNTLNEFFQRTYYEFEENVKMYYVKKILIILAVEYKKDKSVAEKFENSNVYRYVNNVRFKKIARKMIRIFIILKGYKCPILNTVFIKTIIMKGKI